jgi:glycosyltransferase involved in cell wall biosynthesis
MAMASVAARADVLVCISEATRQDVERFYPGTKGRTRVIYNGIDPAVFYPLNETDLAAGRVHLSTALGIEDEFLLFAGTLEPRKNLANTLKAFAHLKRTGRFNGKLVVAGMKGWLDGAASGLVGDLGIARDVVFLGYLTDTELRYLYNLCAVFVFPSFYEGFGFPVVEAMACGAVVVTSNVSSCGEVAGDGALTVDPASHLAIAEAIGQGVEDTVLRRQLKEKALVRAAGFFLKRTVTETALLHETFG